MAKPDAPAPRQDLVRVTERTTPAQLEEALGNLTSYARVCRRHRLAEEAETPYERAHREMDRLLYEWQVRRGQASAPHA